MKIYLVRHAQSQWQLAPSGDWDTPLTSTGHEQARRLAEWLAEHESLDSKGRVQIASLCASTLLRAIETGSHVAAALNLPLDTHPILCEATFQVSAHLPQNDDPILWHSDHQPSGLYSSFKSQAQNALTHLVASERKAGGPVLAITHGALIETMLRTISSSDAISFDFYNSGLNLIEYSKGRWHIMLINCCDHLPPHLRTT